LRFPFRMHVSGRTSLPVMVTAGKHCRSRPVSKDHGNSAAAGRKIESTTVVFTSYDKHIPVHSGFDILIGYRKGVDEATTLISYVKSRTGVDVQHFLDLHSPSGKIVIGT